MDYSKTADAYSQKGLFKPRTGVFRGNTSPLASKVQIREIAAPAENVSAAGNGERPRFRFYVNPVLLGAGLIAAYAFFRK